MHNWHLPLLAFLAFLHPIFCFSEHSLVDGREQRCYSNNLLRDTRLPYGTFCYQKPSDDRRLNIRAEIRRDRRYDVKKDVSELTGFARNRRLIDFRSESEASRNSREVADRLTRTENQRVRLINVLRERSLPTLELGVRGFSPATRRIASKDSREERIQDIVRQRDSRILETRMYERDNRDHRGLSRVNSNRMVRNSGDEARHTASYDSWRDNQRIRDRELVNDFRREHSRETRNFIRRTRTFIARPEISRDGREVRERMDERRVFSLRPDSREHRSLEREVPDSRDTRLWSLASRSADRIRSFRQESSSRLREDVRNERQRVDSRRDLAERINARRQSRPLSREVRNKSQRDHRERTVTIHLASRERMTEERRSSRNSLDRVRNVDNRDMRLERVVNRRDSRTDERVARVYNRDNRAASENRRLESRIINQEIRQHESILSRKDRRSSDRMEIRDMKREVRSRSTEAKERDTIRIEQRMTNNNMERGDMDSRFRTSEFRRVRESVASTIGEKIQTSEQSKVLNWQYLFYTLQGVYLCSVLIQMSDNGSKKKSR